MRFEQGDGTWSLREEFETASDAWSEATDSKILKPQDLDARKSGKVVQITATEYLRLKSEQPSLPRLIVLKFDPRTGSQK